MLQVTPALEESLETAAVKDCTPLPLSDAVVGLTLTLMEGGGFEFDPLLFPPQPERKTSAAKPDKLILRPDRAKVFERTVPPRL
jgi:hypothetical protein